MKTVLSMSLIYIINSYDPPTQPRGVVYPPYTDGEGDGDLTCIGVMKLFGGIANNQTQGKSKATTLAVHHPDHLTTSSSW